jgi:hypothetical protein
MGIEMEEMEVGITPEDLFNDRKGDEMVSPEKDRKFPRTEDLLKGLPDPLEGDRFVSEGQVQVSHIVKGNLGKVSFQIGAVSFDPPGGPADG